MTPWLTICGVGLVYSLPHVQEHSLASLPRVSAQDEDFVKPDLTALPELLTAWRHKPCPPLRRIPLYARMGLLAALQALGQSGWQEETPSENGHADTALIVGSAHSGIVMSMDFMDSILDAAPRLSSPTAFSHAVNNMGAGLMSLLLDVRGPCQTITQFELSFAGAVQTAAYLLHSGRVKRVIVGAMDEADIRFSTCCPQMTAVAQGAAFFCLEKGESKGRGQMRVDFGTQIPDHVSRIVLSGAAQHEKGEDLSSYYGKSQWTQALDVYLALQDAAQHKGSTGALCTDSLHGRSALVEVRS